MKRPKFYTGTDILKIIVVGLAVAFLVADVIYLALFILGRIV